MSRLDNLRKMNSDTPDTTSRPMTKLDQLRNTAQSIDSANRMNQEDVRYQNTMDYQNLIQSVDTANRMNRDDLGKQRIAEGEGQAPKNDFLESNSFTRGLRDYVLEPIKQGVENSPMLLGLPGKFQNNPLSQATAEYSQPDAPYIGDPFGPTAREAFLQRSGQERSTGVSKFIGQAAAPFFVPGAQLGSGTQASNAAEGLLTRFAPKLNGIGQAAAREGLAGAVIGAASEYAQGQNDLGNAGLNALYGAGLGAAGGAAFKGLDTGLERFRNRGTVVPDNISPQVEEMLALPSPRVETRVTNSMERGNLPRGESPVVPAADIPANALPMGNYIEPQRLKVEDPTTVLNSVMQRIKPEVEETINALRQSNQPIDVPQIAFDTAKKYGYDLPSLLEGKAPNITERVSQDASKRTYGIYPDQLPNVRQPEGFNVSKPGQTAPLETRLGYRRGATQSPRISAKSRNEPLGSGRFSASEPAMAPGTRNQNELGFAQTVRESPNTTQQAVQLLTEAPLMGNRTTNAADLAKAQKHIEKQGIIGATNELLAKKKISSVDNFVAQELLQHYQKTGDMDSFLSVLNKTARENRFMGQALQALTRWNKLDAEGAALLANKVVNRGRSAADSVDLTVEQLKPITAATEKIGAADKTRNLADEVMKIVTNKANGEALTKEEQTVIQEFQNQVKEVNAAAKSFLPKENKTADVTIKEVGEIKPKERTRDQVVNYLDAKAEKARKRLASQRNIGFAAQSKGNPAIDYAIIGASKVAKGVVKLADFTEQMVKEYGQGVKPMINEIYNRSVNIFRKENGLPTIQELDRVVQTAIKRNSLTPDEAYMFKAWANEIGFMSDNFKVEATQDLQLALKRLDTSTLGQKISSIQAANQLLSIPTVLRNVIGNEAMNITEKINKIAAVPIDMALSKLTGQRTIVFKTNNQEKYWSNFVNGAKGGWKGVSPNGQLSSSDIYPEVFGERNPLKYLVKLTGAELQSFDHASYMRAYGETVGTYATLLGREKGLSAAQIKQQMPQLIKQLDDNILDLADQAGLYATFQDETLLAKGAQGMKSFLNNYSTGKLSRYLVDKGALPKSLSTEGFGLGDVVIKYAKTPANIVMRGIDYSPLGFMRALGELIPLVTKKEFNQREATLALSRAITGTLGLTGMGYILANAGILTGGSSSDSDIRGLEGMSGKGAYKVNWSGLGRYIMSGLDKNAAKYRDGDKLMNYAWLQPAALSLAMGVDANVAMNDKKLGVDKSSFEVALNALSGGLKSMLEQPLVTGIKQIAGIRSWDDVGKIFKGIPSSFVPALSGQARGFTDNATRSTYDPNLLKEMLNMVVNRIPGLSKGLPQTYSTLGTPNERIQGGDAFTPGQFANYFLNPAKFTAYTVTPEAKLVIDLINQTGETKVAPRTVGKTLIVDDPATKKNKSIELSNEQYTKLQQVVGQKTAEGLKKLQPYLTDQNKKDDDKVKKVVELLDKVGNDARNDLRKQMGYKIKK
ncbi:hypothetical protein [Paenibacillus rigui]|uniref:Large polyvalent protein associated domain-containing protein n=1 Tax=Paenibacillus rigui TaxID=554312 RepID=A0A229UM36_9BACL|nr:hypothetical protein [Paenibacillus rigui]OXM83959.1 hypothetical protein CF651_22870 [Paenibacillus rigui]